MLFTMIRYYKKAKYRWHTNHLKICIPCALDKVISISIVYIGVVNRSNSSSDAYCFIRNPQCIFQKSTDLTGMHNQIKLR